MTQVNSPGEEPGLVEDANSPADKSPRAAFVAPDSGSAESKSYPDVAETDPDARQDQSVSGEEEDFLSE